MSLNARAVGKGESKLLNSADVFTSIRDLIVHLHRGNGAQSESIVTDVAAYLKEVMLSGADPEEVDMQRAQQTMFAIDEVRMLLAQQDFEGAATAARDAAKEWKQKPRPALD
jgi:hypothetical protein